MLVTTRCCCFVEMLVEILNYIYELVDNRNKFIINQNMNIDLFDMFFKSLSDNSIETDTTLSEVFERLSKLFDNNVVEY